MIARDETLHPRIAARQIEDRRQAAFLEHQGMGAVGDDLAAEADPHPAAERADLDRMGGSEVGHVRLLGSGPITGNGQDSPEKGTRRGGVRRAGLVCPHERFDVAGVLLRATAKRRGGDTALLSSLGAVR